MADPETSDLQDRTREVSARKVIEGPRRAELGKYADMMNTYPKHVVSTTLEEPLEWNNSTLMEGDVRCR